MRTLLLVALVSACASSAPSRDASTRPARYHVELRVDVPSERVHARAYLSGIGGPVRLEFAEQYAFTRLKPRLAGEITLRLAEGSTASIERTSPFAWSLDPAGASDVELVWAIDLDHREHPDVLASHDAYEFPYVTADHGMLSTAATVPYPTLDALDATITIEAPEGWDVITPWPERADGTFAPGAGGLRNDLVALGDWQVVRGHAAGLDYTIAVAPGEEHVTELAAESIPRIVEAEVAMFGGAPQPGYLFLFGSSTGTRGMGGSPKNGAMTMFVDGTLPKDFVREGIAHLVAHEYHHTWMRARCQPHDDLRHVMEGFTDYAAYSVIWRLGILDDAAFEAAVAGALARGERALAEYPSSLADAGGPAFFAGGAAYDACYAGGLSIALWLDLELRRAKGETPDVDALLRAFYNDDRWSDGTRPALDDFVRVVESCAGEDVAKRYLEAVTRKEPLDLAALFDASGFGVTRELRPLDASPRANFDGAVVRAIDPAGAGGIVGLRAGDRLVRVNGREAEDEAQIRAAWRAVEGDELTVVWTRDGEPMTYRGAPPSAPHYDLADEVVELLTSR